MNNTVAVIKRLIDLVGSIMGLVLSAPVFPLIAIAIYLESPGPVFYRQRRAGRLRPESKAPDLRFEEFDMYKFRSMRPDAERDTGPVLAQENDPRITRVGRWLRRTRLDELPQLWNVLRGQMSIVGPRPERAELLTNLALAIPFFEERMRDIKPGITGLAQVSVGYTGQASPGSRIFSHLETLVNPFRFEETRGALADDMRLKLLFDAAYSAALCRVGTYLRTELAILARTPWVMLSGAGR